MKIEADTYRKLIKLRNILQIVTQISFNYSMINKRFPFENLDEKSALEVIKMYKDCLNDLISLKTEYETDTTS